MEEDGRRNEKSPEVSEAAVPNEQVTQKIFQHEDAAQKYVMQFMSEELLAFFHIEGKVVAIGPTESVYLELKKLYQDTNLVMDDSSWKHFEYQSKDGGVEDLKRFRAYESVASYQHKVAITTYVLYSGKIKNPVTEFTEGVNTYRVVPIVLQEYDAEVYFRDIQQKMKNEKELTKEDLVPLALCPLMGGEMSQKERIREAFSITREMEKLEPEMTRKIESVVYTMADKFLSKEEMNEIKEEMKMTTMGQMLVNDGIAIGMERGIATGMERGITTGINLTKKVFRMNAAGVDCEAIAKECEINIDTVQKILED